MNSRSTRLVRSTNPLEAQKGHGDNGWRDLPATRRQAIAQTAATALSLMSAEGANAGVPLPKPLTLEEQIKYHARLIYTGRVRRAVYLSPATSKRLFTQGVQIEPAELRLYERRELEAVGEGFLEIEDASPVLIASDVQPKELAELAWGNVYWYVRNFGGNKEKDKYISSLVGQMAVFLFHTRIQRIGVAVTSFPYPIYGTASTGNWRELLPLPIEDLVRVTAIARRFGFVQPVRNQR